MRLTAGEASRQKAVLGFVLAWVGKWARLDDWGGHRGGKWANVGLACAWWSDEANRRASANGWPCPGSLIAWW